MGCSRVLLTVAVLTACSSIDVEHDAQCADAPMPCTRDEHCTELGPYGYCRIFPDEGEEIGYCVRD